MAWLMQNHRDENVNGTNKDSKLQTDQSNKKERKKTKTGGNVKIE